MAYKRKQQEIKCDGCNTLFNKDVSEIKRNTKLDRKNYCSRSCLGKVIAVKNFTNRDTSHLNSANRKDEYSMFREHLRRAKRRGKEINLTLGQLKEQWDRQQGICVYSRVKLQEVSKNNDPIYTMSLDRVDSSKGYVQNNIQFISIAMNHLKHDMTHNKMMEMLKILKN